MKKSKCTLVFSSLTTAYVYCSLQRNNCLLSATCPFYPHAPPLLFSDAQTLEQNAREYTPEHVSQFLQGIGLGQHAIAFNREDISGEMLLEATDEMLKELGITSTVEMLKIKVHGSA